MKCNRQKEKRRQGGRWRNVIKNKEKTENEKKKIITTWNKPER